MGYHTDFSGSFTVTPPLKPEHAEYLRAFNETRRMKRNEFKTDLLPDPLRKAVGLPVGEEGEFYVGAHVDGMFGQRHTDDVVDYNTAPADQPSLWCQWVPSEDGTALVWDEGEKFYEYVEWLEYLIANFFVLWGYQLSGTVTYEGEDGDDFGTITVEGDEVMHKPKKRVW